MNESGGGEASPSNAEIINRNYQTSRNVRARFELYSFSEPELDVEAKTIDSLNLTGSEHIVDVGTADGSFLQRLRVEHGHSGRLTGIEPNTSQFNQAPIWQPLDPVRLAESLRKIPLASDQFDELAKALSSDLSPDIHLLYGEADRIQLPDDSADVVTAMFMLYHVPEAKQPQAFAEFNRILRGGGIFVMATSGAENKRRHRIFEKLLAQELDITEPQLMNSGFDTERAEVELPKYFKHVYRFPHDANMVIDDDYRFGAYLNSLRSLRDQFSPIPSEEDFDAVLERVVVPILDRKIKQGQAFTDNISRSILIGSNQALPELEQKGFTKIA